MADYYSQCVVSPTLPLTDLTAAERLVLCAIFDSEVDEQDLYLFAEISRSSSITLELPDALVALSATAAASAATRLLSKGVADTPEGEDLVEIDVEDAWTEIFQEIVRRSDTLSFVAIETGLTCSRMRSDGFGGAAVVVTADTCDTMSTSQFIDETLAARFAAVPEATPVMDLQP
jgi:hypothetical protein